MKKAISINTDELAALEVLKRTGVDVLEAALIAKEALEVGRGKVRRARRCIAMGEIELKRQEKTVTFERAVEAALDARKERRKRTIAEFRYITRRLMKNCKTLIKRRIRSLKAEECAVYLHQAFHTPRQRNKARLILSGVFSTAIQKGWCSENPMRFLKAEKVKEKRISILSKNEIENLIKTAEQYDGGACLAATAIMLFAGVRPHETERLLWQDVRVEEGVISIAPNHSKTGGARHVTIHAPLAKILRKIQKSPNTTICPPNWHKHWAGLHRAAGFTTWQPDVLRHTFATHHLAAFRNYAELQLEMGHRSTELLRSRYIAMEGLLSYRQGDSILVEK